MPGQAEYDATKCALQTDPGMKPRRDFNDSRIEICGANGSDLVDKQSHANSCIEKTGSNFCRVCFAVLKRGELEDLCVDCKKPSDL